MPEKNQVGLGFYCVIAETGHEDTQAPQSMHVSSAHSALPSPLSVIAPVGHTPQHVPQPMQTS